MALWGPGTARFALSTCSKVVAIGFSPVINACNNRHIQAVNDGNDSENIKKSVAGSSLELANRSSWRMDNARLSFHILPSPPVTESVKLKSSQGCSTALDGQGFDEIPVVSITTKNTAPPVQVNEKGHTSGRPFEFERLSSSQKVG